MNLTFQQQQAATSTAPVTICSAAAGAGKSRTLVARINWLLDQGVKPEDIVAVTFTSIGAKVILERCKAKIAFAGTLHALMLRLLRQYGSLIGLPTELTIMDETESEAQLLGIAGKLKVKASMKELKCELQGQFYDREKMSVTPAITVARECFRQMKQMGELSYDCLLWMGRRLIEEHPTTAPWKHLLVDEANDSAVIDFKIYAAIKAETKMFCGDSKQRIYSFRSGYCHEFEEMDGTPTPLTVNFRSATMIVSAANRIAAKMAHKTEPSQTRPDAPLGVVTVTQHPDALTEINAVASRIFEAIKADQTVAVLLRTNRAADTFRNALAAMGIPVAQVKPTGCAPDENLGLALLRAMNAPHNDRLLLRLVHELEGSAAAVKLAKRAEGLMTTVAAMLDVKDTSDVVIGDPSDAVVLAHDFCFRTSGTQADVKAAGYYLQRIAEQTPLPATLSDLLITAMARPEETTEDAPCSVSTYHKVKGLEFDTILMPSLESDEWPGTATGDDEEEIKRLFYVGVTRAKESLHISWSQNRNNLWTRRPETKQPSPFLKWIL